MKSNIYTVFALYIAGTHKHTSHLCTVDLYLTQRKELLSSPKIRSVIYLKNTEMDEPGE